MNMPIMSAAASMNLREMRHVLLTMQIMQRMPMLSMLVTVSLEEIEPTAKLLVNQPGEGRGS